MFHQCAGNMPAAEFLSGSLAGRFNNALANMPAAALLSGSLAGLYVVGALSFPAYSLVTFLCNDSLVLQVLAPLPGAHAIGIIVWFLCSATLTE